MEVNMMLGAELSSIRQSIGIGLLKSAQATQVAQATALIESMAQAQPAPSAAPHPTLGTKLDVSV